jgi:hypothetical protein
MLVVVLLAVAIRLPAFFTPMGSEAGRIAHVGRRWVAGAVPYRDVWDRDPPGVYLLAGTVVYVLGPSPALCRLAMLALDLGTLALLCALARLWCTRSESLVVGALWALFGGAAMVQGDCLAAGPPAVLLLTAMVYATLRGSSGRRLWFLAAGIAGGLATAMQPMSVVPLVALILWSLRAGRAERPLAARAGRAGTMLAGALLPVGALVAWFAAQGPEALTALWDSVFVYNIRYRWRPEFAVNWPHNMAVVRGLAPEQGALWLFSAGWVAHAFSQGFRRETGLAALWLVASALPLMLGQRIEPTDFLLVVPPMAIAAGLAVTNPSEPFLQRDERGRLSTSSRMLMLFALMLAGGFLYAEQRTYTSEEALERLRNDRAAAEVARLLKARTNPLDAIYVWGNSPQIYVLANRPAAHRLFFRRPLNSPHVVRDYFGQDIVPNIFQSLRRQEVPFFVTTETAVLKEDIVGEFLSGGYVLWGEPDEPPPEWYAIFARPDRIGDPDKLD